MGDHSPTHIGLTRFELAPLVFLYNPKETPALGCEPLWSDPPIKKVLARSQFFSRLSVHDPSMGAADDCSRRDEGETCSSEN